MYEVEDHILEQNLLKGIFLIRNQLSENVELVKPNQNNIFFSSVYR